MVQFPGSCFLEPMYSTQDDLYLTGRVTPFGYPRIYGCLLLPVDFRSLPRPSSPDSSKTSTVNSYSLDHITLSPASNHIRACMLTKKFHSSCRIQSHSSSYAYKKIPLFLSHSITFMSECLQKYCLFLCMPGSL